MIHTPRTLKAYRKQIRKTLEQQFLRKTLDNFAVAYRESRVKAFADLGGTLQQREPRRYQVTHVPAILQRLDDAVELEAAVVPLESVTP